MMEILSIQKFIHTSPRKLRLVADMVRKMEPVRAVKTLEFTNKAAALSLGKAIKTAIANAKQQNLNEENLIFKSLEINEAQKMGRMNAGSRGRANPYKKRWSHIKIVLTDEAVIKEVKESK